MATLTISKEEEKRVKALGFLSNKGTDNFSGRVLTVNGKITAEQMQCIAEAARAVASQHLAQQSPREVSPQFEFRYQ